MSHITTPHPAESAPSVPGPAPADGTEPTITESVVTTTEPTITESVVSTLAGVALGGAALWFVAPICFVC